MNSLPKWFLGALSNGERIAFLVILVSLAGSAVASIVARSAKDVFSHLQELVQAWSGRSGPHYIPKRSRTLDSAYRPPVRGTPSEVAQERALVRIGEAAEAMRTQVSAARWSRISANFLTVGQYVIGGLLASSFVKDALSQKLVGLLGVMVLLASLIKQHFHPEINAEDARKKAAQLKALIRTSEDQLTILDAKVASGQDHTDALIALLIKITDRLTEIETPEVFEQRAELPEKSA